MLSSTGDGLPPLSGAEESAIAFSIPDPDTLPIDDLIVCNDRVLRRDGGLALQYGGAQGYAGLREWLAGDVNRREEIGVSAEHFVLTCGSAGAVEDLCEAILDPGDIAFVERPTFPGTLRTMQSRLARVVGLPIDEEGLDPEHLERAIARAKRDGQRPKLLYTQANVHNPTGVTMSLARRQRIIEICRAANVLIAQDDAYGLLSFEGHAPPSLYTLAGGDGAVLFGTFSKTLATGLRVGWVMGERTVIDAVTRVRLDMGVSPWTTRVISDFCERGLFDKHVNSVVQLYRRKCSVMQDNLRRRLPQLGRWTMPRGGFFLWIELADYIDPRTLYAAAWEEGAGYVDGRAFFDDGVGARFVRLCFSKVGEREIPAAIERFRRAVERASR
jgi:2-aminoadipate transaminase